MAIFPQLLPMTCLKSHHNPGLREIKRMLLKIRSGYFASLPKGNKQNPSIQNDTNAFYHYFDTKTWESNALIKLVMKRKTSDLDFVFQYYCYPQAIRPYSFHTLFFFFFNGPLFLDSRPWINFSQSSFSNKCYSNCSLSKMPWKGGGRGIEKWMESTNTFYPEASSLLRGYEFSHNHVY